MTCIETIDVPKNIGSTAAIHIHRHWQDRPHTFWLDSACDPQRLGRYSFLGTDPYATLRAEGREVTYTTHNTVERWTDDPLRVLARIAEPVFQKNIPADFATPFAGGLVGYLGYDLGYNLMSLPKQAQRDLSMPDMAFGLYDAVVCIDHLEGRLHFVSTGLPFSGRAAANKAEERLAWLQREVEQAFGSDVSEPDIPPVAVSWRHEKGATSPRLQSTFSRDAYLHTVEQVLAAIDSGVIDQVNLAQRFTVNTNLTGPDLYGRLRAISPAPYAGLLRVDDAWILSSSPERFLLIQGDHIETRPIKGTRPRSADPVTDAQNRGALLASKKDAAEHNMIVDMVCDELGRVCVPGSVGVPERMLCEEYETVFHLVSTVVGRLAAATDRIEALRALFPGGSITGRPKVRSMELIEKLEPVSRGVYTGAMGYLGVGGNIDLNVAIRTLVLEDGKAHFHVGGAIVAESKPEDEYEETLDKAEGMVRALLTPEMR